MMRARMPISVLDLARANNPLADHYRQFRVADRLLLTGHSHQAWPDCSMAAQQQAWLDAAEYVDHKWSKAEAQAVHVRAGFARLLGEPGAEIALGQNTHELVLRFLSGLDLTKRPKIITTDSEFHTLRRQLQRLAQEGIELVVVSQMPAHTLCERLLAAIDDRTAAVMMSHVFFNSGRIFSDFAPMAARCQHVGAELLVDVYHALNVVPVDLMALGLAHAYVVGGGYKYCQLGEGNCFLRVPSDCTMQPVNTGWFAEFALLHEQPGHAVQYGKGAARFAGSTYDPASHYRAAAVFHFFVEQQLTPPLLRELSQHQMQVLIDGFTALDLPPDIYLEASLRREDRAGFLAIQTPYASKLCESLFHVDVITDARGDSLRFGPAPYLTDHQLREAMWALGEAYRQL